LGVDCIGRLAPGVEISDAGGQSGTHRVPADDSERQMAGRLLGQGGATRMPDGMGAARATEVLLRGTHGQSKLAAT
jgi:hypothetical protein